MIYSQCPWFLGVTLGGVSFFPLNPYGIFFLTPTPRHFRRFSFPLWLGGIHCTALCEFGLATYGWCCSGKVGGSIGATEHSGKLPPSWLVNLPPPKVPASEIRVYIIRPHEGKPKVNKQALFLGGCTLGGVGWPAMKPPLSRQKLNELGQKGIRDNDQIHNAYNNSLVLSDEANQQRMATFPTKWRANEQLVRGLSTNKIHFFVLKKHPFKHLLGLGVEQMVRGMSTNHTSLARYFLWGKSWHWWSRKVMMLDDFFPPTFATRVPELEDKLCEAPT